MTRRTPQPGDTYCAMTSAQYQCDCGALVVIADTDEGPSVLHPMPPCELFNTMTAIAYATRLVLGRGGV